MYVAKNYGGVNERLKAMFDEIMKLKGYTKISKGRYVKKPTRK